MAFMPRDGANQKNTQDLANAATGQPNLPANIEDTNPLKQQAMFDTDRLDQYPIVQNPALDRMSFDQNAYLKTERDLQAYMEGTRITVTYFRQWGIAGDVRTNISDYPNERSITNTGFQRINNYEITLKGPLVFQYDDTKGDANAVSEFLAYAGMTPMIGDFFIYAVGDNKLGIFRVSSSAPLSWKDDKVCLCGCYFYNYADNGNLDFLTDATRETRYFDKTSFLGGTSTLLEEDYYLQIQEMRQLRDVLAKYYYRTFLDRGLGTFINPSQGYDPYVVKFMASICSFKVVKDRPQQMYSDTDLTYDNTLWARLSDRVNTTIDDLYPYCSGRVGKGQGNFIMLTPLLNRPYLVVTPRSDDDALSTIPVTYYVLSAEFYNNDYTNMSPFEKVVWDVIKQRKLTDTSSLLSNYLRTYTTLSKEDAFYHIPIYLKLIDIAIDSVSRKPPSTPF